MLLAGGAVLAGAWAFPALAAWACPACYGLERAAPQLWVERAMSTRDRAALIDGIEASRAIAAAFLDGYDADPALLACASEACDARLGGKGARATAYTTPLGTVIRRGPRGLGREIVAHELIHAEVHARTGAAAQREGRLPAWVDEGFAVIGAEDARLLPPAIDCDGLPEATLPASPFEWGPAAGRDPKLYAHAACAVRA